MGAPIARATVLLGPVTLLAFAACAGDFGDRAREEVHTSIVSGSAPAVRVDNIAGAIRIDGTPRSDVDVNATKYGHDADELRGVVIAVNREPGGVSIATQYTGGRHAGGVRYRIAVPAGASLTVGNVAGTVDIAGVLGNITVETQTGAIVVDAGSVAGNRAISLRATTGAIKLLIAPGSSARVDAASTVGAFETDVPGVTQQRQNLVGASGGGTIGSGSALIRLSTTTGAIALRRRS